MHLYSTKIRITYQDGQKAFSFNMHNKIVHNITLKRNKITARRRLKAKRVNLF